MKILIIAFCIIVLGLGVGLVIRERSRPRSLSIDQVATIKQGLAKIESNRPKIEVSNFGVFHLEYDFPSWYQISPNHQTPDGKPIRIIFGLPAPKITSPPTKTQIDFTAEVFEKLPQLWPSFEKSFAAYFKEMGDPAAFEKAEDWEITLESGSDSKPVEWMISCKIPGGNAGWYQIHSQDFEVGQAYGTY